MALDATGMTLGGPPQSGYNWSFFDRSESSNRRNSHDLGSLDPDALGFEPGTAMAIDECARIFTGIAKPKDFNVTCLDHAPVLTHMVEKRDFGTMLYKFQVLYKNRVKRKEGSAKLLGSLSATLLVYLTFPDESSFVMEVMEQTVNSQNNSVLAVVRAIVLAVLAVLSLVGNFAAIIAIIRDRHRTSLCTMILHLSIADLFVSFFCLGGEALWTYSVGWKLGNIACKVFKYWQSFGLFLSTYLVVVIGLDRWIAISQPLKRSQGGRSRARVWTWTAWILSAILSLPQLVIFHVDRGPFIEDFYQCVTYGFYTAKWQETLYSIFYLLLMFVVPLVILIVTYAQAIIKLKQSERSFEATSDLSHSESHRQKRMRKATKRSLHMSLYIVGGFLLCWIPYYTLSFWLLFKTEEEKQEEGSTLMENIFFFGMSNSLINPLIYGAFHLWRPNAGGGNSGGGGSSAVPTFNARQPTISIARFSSRNSKLLSSSAIAENNSGGRGDVAPRMTFKHPSFRRRGGKHLRSCLGAVERRCANAAATATAASSPNPRPPPVTRAKTAHNGAGGGGAYAASMTRCATFDCATERVDRKKVSLKRRQLKGRLDSQSDPGGSISRGLAFDYSQEILGVHDKEEKV